MHEPSDAGSRGPTRARVLRDGLFFLALGAVLVVAHLTVEARRSHGQRYGAVLSLDAWQANTYDGAFLASDPSLITLGASQLVMVMPTERNGFAGDGVGDTITDVLARSLDARYPAATPRTYVRLTGSDFTPIEELAAIGLWVTRAKPRPIPVLIGLDVVTNARPPRVKPQTWDMLRQYPDSARQLFEALAPLPQGEEAIKLLSPPPAPPPPPPIDRVEQRISKWSRSHRFYYGEPYTTPLAPIAHYQKAEERPLRSLFGRVVQPGAMPERPKPAPYPFLTTLVRFLETRGMTVVCYAEPRNPALYPPSPALDGMIERLRTTSTDAGCTFIDAYHALRAPEYFGYAGAHPDEGHLSPAGHEALAALLFAEGEKLGVWSTFASAASPEGGAQ